MTTNATTRRIQTLLRTTDLTQSEIAREVGVQRQRVLQVRKGIDENPYQDFDGSKLKERREKLGWSMSRMAVRLGVHTSQVSRWEAGKQAPRPNQWRKICRVLRCFVQDLEKEGTV
jgi:transcriptional regulator with XRE-family HTH domain